MELSYAQTITNEVITLLKPYCECIEVAGSVRRGAVSVNDIDIVMIPHSWKLERFLLTHNINILETKKQRPSLRHGTKHKQILYKGIKVELWASTPQNYGLTLLIRTGSADFSKQMLTRWKIVTKGGESRECFLHDAAGKKYDTPTEHDVFRLCQMNFVEPSKRI